MILWAITFSCRHPLKYVIGLTLVMAGTEVFGQTGTRSFTSLDIPASAQLSGLGGVNVSRNDFANFSQNNPALSSDTLNGRAAINHLFYFAGVGLTGFSYQHDFDKVGPVSFGFNHLNLGTSQGYDIFGSPTGAFTSGESSFIVGKAHQVNSFRLGVNLKGIFSSLAGYRASALVLDIGGAFVHPKKDLTIGLAIKNAGLVLQEFSPGISSELPFDVQAGLTYKPDHMPIRFSGTVYRLLDYTIPYEDAGQGSESRTTLDKVLSHVNFGAELLIHKNVNILLGYNFLKHQELKLEEAGGGSGISIGALIKVKQFDLAFSRTGYVTGGAYQVSLGIDTKKLLKRG